MNRWRIDVCKVITRYGVEILSKGRMGEGFFILGVFSVG